MFETLITSSQYGSLTATGAATIAGELEIKQVKSYVPAKGQTYELLKTSALTGTFSKVKKNKIKKSPYSYVPHYSSTGVTLGSDGRPRDGAPGSRYAGSMRTPDAIVLGGGGLLGEAWMSALLAGLEHSPEFDCRASACYVGTSAGSIVAASLAAGLEPGARLGQLPDPAVPPAEGSQERATALSAAFAAAGKLAGAAATPLAPFAFASTAPGGAMLRRAALRGIPEGKRSLEELGRHVELAGVTWDGRLRVVAVERESGRRVVFGAPGGPEVPVSRAVQASCAIPGYFRPIRAHGRSYVDGGLWSPTNIDVAAASRGQHVLCLNPTASLRQGSRALTGAIATFSRAVTSAEALVLKNRGASVTTINPDARSAAAMGANLMDARPRQAVIEAGLAQGRRLAAEDHRAAA